MYRSIPSFMTLVSCFSIGFGIQAEEVSVEKPFFVDEKSNQTETTGFGVTNSVAKASPKIIARFFTTEMCRSIDKLKSLEAVNPGFHKILLKVEGYPKQKEIIVEIKRSLGKSPSEYIQLTSFTIQDDGSFLTKDKQKRDYLIGTSRGFYPGERVYVRIQTVDGSVSQEVAGVPNPVIYRDPEGAIALKAELISTSPTVYVIELPTMKEGEEYELISTALGEVTKSKIIHSKDTPLHYSPVSKDKNTGGYSTLKIKRKSSKLYTLRMPWGTALEPYLQGNKCYPYHH